MDKIISFLETYWGYTLIGTVTLGTVVANIGTLLKMYFQNKLKNKAYDAVVDKHNVIAEKYKDLEVKYNEQVQRNEYMNRVIATVFKAISYITMASKLPTEDKIALQEDFTKLGKAVKENIVSKVKENTGAVIESVIETVDDVADIVKDTVSQTDGLLTKYLGDK
jgi:hypothetical protein